MIKNNLYFLNIRIISLLISILLPILSMNACSPASAVSSTAAMAGLFGAGAGAAGGVYLGQQDIGVTANEGAAALGAAGALVGLTAGAIAHQNEIDKQKQTYYDRVPYETDLRAGEIERVHTYVDESSSWGRNEVKSYEDRYPLEDENRPFQGKK